MPRNTGEPARAREGRLPARGPRRTVPLHRGHVGGPPDLRDHRRGLASLTGRRDRYSPRAQPRATAGQRGRWAGMGPLASLALETLLATLAPPRCAACDERVRLLTVFCPSCARTTTSAAGEPGRPCAALVYGGAVARAIARMKYESRPDLARPLGDLLWRPSSPTPLRSAERSSSPSRSHPSRLAERGFNQSALLARRVARHLGAPFAPRALARTRETPQQATLDRAARIVNVAGAFEVRGARASALVRGALVLLVDDVMTTGATLDACERALAPCRRRADRAGRSGRCAAARRRRRLGPGGARLALGVSWGRQPVTQEKDHKGGGERGPGEKSPKTLVGRALLPKSSRPPPRPASQPPRPSTRESRASSRRPPDPAGVASRRPCPGELPQEPGSPRIPRAKHCPRSKRSAAHCSWPTTRRAAPPGGRGAERLAPSRRPGAAPSRRSDGRLAPGGRRARGRSPRAAASAARSRRRLPPCWACPAPDGHPGAQSRGGRPHDAWPRRRRRCGHRRRRPTRCRRRALRPWPPPCRPTGCRRHRSRCSKPSMASKRRRLHAQSSDRGGFPGPARGSPHRKARHRAGLRRRRGDFPPPGLAGRRDRSDQARRGGR